MKCQRCDSDRLCEITAKSSDLNGGSIVGVEFDGYVPDGVGIGGGDYVEFRWCLECGQIQGKWPLETPPSDSDSEDGGEPQEETCEHGIPITEPCPDCQNERDSIG